MSDSPEVNGSVGEKAYRRIRTDIIFGRLVPGQKLKLDGLKEAYGTSVSTLRELLNRLSSEGLIVAEGLRGFEVTPVSADNWREVAELRQLLECHALRQSFASGDLEWEGRVVSAHHKLALMEKKLLSGDRNDPELWKRYDWEFHHALISACGSKALLEAHSAIYDKYLRYQMIAVVFRGEIAAREHRQLLECALKRDAATAQTVLIKHIQDCLTYTLSKGPVELRAPSASQPAKRRKPIAPDSASA
ncbi:MAG: GntR family transcriptional regulator [Pseudolabrys sp.]